jgi:Galactose oxidase-like, Early set domain
VSDEVRIVPRSYTFRLTAAATALALVAVVGVSRMAYAQTELVINGGLELMDGSGFPSCFERSGWGENTYEFSVTDQAHSGFAAVRLEITGIDSGDRKVLMYEDPTCAPHVTQGHQYDLSVWYQSTSPDTVLTMFRHDVNLGWQYWTDPATLEVSTVWARKTVRTPQVPPDTDQITWGVTLYGVGVLVTDDYSMVDATPEPPPYECTAGDACTMGEWEIMPMASPARAMHTVVLHDGRVLLIAGSGNNTDLFAAGTFKTAIYDPMTGTFAEVATPADLFCAGHVQLADGRVLVMSGNLDYPDAAGTHGYEGLKDSYIFDPATNSYTRINDLHEGHWYPSATILGNGDVISLGGLKEDSTGSVAVEYYNAAQGRWQELWETNQTWSFWGLYPTMILLQDGRLFYSGSHVFGDNIPGPGAAIYDYAANTITPVPGLREPNRRDQSMSVLLPPAQAQRVMIAGGGNINTNPEPLRYTDIIDLTAPSPAYTAGPDLPRAKLPTGEYQAAGQGKMYVSLVILPDGTVLETGGALYNRSDPVFGASIYDPVTNQFTPVAADPLPRGYHSSAVLLPDGRVMAFGDNPADGSYELRVTLYSPPYLYAGPRPQILTVASIQWAYGSTQQITVDGPVAKASLIRPAAVTHSSDPNQRYIDLPMTVDGATIGLNLTSNPNLAPPGWYMLFVVSPSGVPSVATWVHVG